ncbi:MAG: type II secretion system protein GspL [Burkholderiales bacterium]
MIVLVVQIPPRQRLHVGSSLNFPSDAAVKEYNYALTANGTDLTGQGCCTAALLPKADAVVAVLADADVSWHRITLPKAPAAKLSAALIGVLEESVLDDAENTLLAVAPLAVPGQPTWIAALHLPWLRSELAALEQANVFVDRVVPSMWPDDLASGHFSENPDSTEHLGGDALTLSWSHVDGVAVFALDGSLARHLVPRPAPPGTRWTATPGVAQAAERWLGMPVQVMPAPFRLLQASRTLWNLRQFSLARQSRGLRAAQDFYRQFLMPHWRPVRWGLISLALIQMLGLNLWAWRQQAKIKELQAALTQTLKAAFPQVQVVLDAPLQMQRELQTLRTIAGQPSEEDFEPALQAAASAWPLGRPPVEHLQYKEGRLSLAALGWTDAQREQFRNALIRQGWRVEASETQMILSRSSGPRLQIGGGQ